MNDIKDFAINDGLLMHYYGNSSDVVIPEGVKCIGKGVFRGCSEITALTIPEGVTRIRDEAFDNCSGLTILRIPSTLTCIGENSYRLFADCSNLKEVHIEHLDSYVSMDKSRWLNTPLCDGAVLYWNDEPIRDLVIPSGVKCIGEKAFWEYAALTSVTIPEGVTRIGKRAFEGCASFTRVIIPDSVKSIGAHAFSNCRNLTSVFIPDGVKSIESFAFYGCGSLTSVTIPESVKTIEQGAFEGCSSLSSVTLLNKVTNIGANAFSGCSSLQSVIIPESVISIGSEAFEGCSSLTSVIIPNSVTSIECNAFIGCNNLGLISVSGDIEKIDENALPYRYDEDEEDDDNTEERCGNIIVRGKPGEGLKKLLSKHRALWKVVVFPDLLCSEVPVLARKSTAVWTADIVMKGGSIPEKVYKSFLKYILAHKAEWLAMSAAEAKPVLWLLVREKQIAITEIDGLIERISHENEPELLNLLMAYQAENFQLEDYDRQSEKEFKHMEQDAEIRTDTTSQKYIKAMWSVGRKEPLVKSFKDAASVVTFPTQVGNITVTGIADHFEFTGDGDAREKIEQIIIPEGYTYIGAEAFCGCTNLKQIVLPSSITGIGKGAFEGCSSLTSIKIPDSVTNIGKAAFRACSNLTNVTIPGSVTTIAEDSFRDCKFLKRATIQNGVTTVGDSAFRGCTNLMSVAIPESLAHIEFWTFFQCDKLKEVDIDSLEAWISMDKSGWIGSPFGGAVLCCNGKPVHDLIIPESVTRIEDKAFLGCDGLTNVTIPSSVTAVGELAFCSCRDLSSVTILEGVTRIGKWAFRGCERLTNVKIPEGVIYVRDEVFEGCNALMTSWNEEFHRPKATLNGLTFAVTGDIESYPNRDELKSVIENFGGRMTGNVSGKTDYLIASDPRSGSSKLKNARKFGVKIIDEDEFLKLAGLE